MSQRLFKLVKDLRLTPSQMAKVTSAYQERGHDSAVALATKYSADNKREKFKHLETVIHTE